MDRAKRIIAVETTGRHGSIALLCGDGDDVQLVYQTVLAGDQRTAQLLVPAMQSLLQRADWSPQSISLVAVAIGPGSFTGLRIGVTTAKTFAYAVGSKVIGVNTLVSLADQSPASPAPLWTILDAQRQEVFAARFVVDKGIPIPNTCQVSIVSEETWLAGLRMGDRVIGPPLRRLRAKLPIGVEVMPEELWQPTAAAVGRVAWRMHQSGQRDDIWKLAPNYYRDSAAEEKAARFIQARRD